MLFDDAHVEAFATAIPLWLAIVLLVLSYLGSIYVIAPAALYMYFRERWETTTWVAILIGSYALFVAIKPLTDVPRPDVESPIPHEELPLLLAVVHDYAIGFETGSFPSGHVVAATVFFGLFTVDAVISSRRRRALLAGIAVLTVGISRIALGSHYVGDVLGGILIGVGYLAVVIHLRSRLDGVVELLLAVSVLLGSIGFLAGNQFDSIILLGTVVLALALHRWVYPEGLRRPS